MKKHIGEKLKNEKKIYEQVRKSYANGLTSLRELGLKHGYSHTYIGEMLKGKESKVPWISNIREEPITPYK